MKPVSDLAAIPREGGFPPRNAGASLKRGVMGGRAHHRGCFPPRNAGASLKARDSDVQRTPFEGFPPRNAGASLKSRGAMRMKLSDWRFSPA